MKTLILAALASLTIAITALAAPSDFEVWWTAFRSDLNDPALLNEQKVFAVWWNHFAETDPQEMANMYEVRQNLLEAKGGLKRAVQTLAANVETRFPNDVPNDIQPAPNFSTFWEYIQTNSLVTEDKKTKFILAWNAICKNNPEVASKLVAQWQKAKETNKKLIAADDEFRTNVERWYLSRDDQEFHTRWSQIQMTLTVIESE